MLRRKDERKGVWSAPESLKTEFPSAGLFVKMSIKSYNIYIYIIPTNTLCMAHVSRPLPSPLSILPVLWLSPWMHWCCPDGKRRHITMTRIWLWGTNKTHSCPFAWHPMNSNRKSAATSPMRRRHCPKPQPCYCIVYKITIFSMVYKI